MDLEEFNRQPQETRDAILAWLHEHDLRYVTDFVIEDGTVHAQAYSADENGKRYLIHRDGVRHVPGDACGPFECIAAEEVRRVPLRSPCPVAA